MMKCCRWSTKDHKFDGTENLINHITIFEIECRNISSNDRLKFQHFSSLLIGNTIRWFNYGPHGFISRGTNWSMIHNTLCAINAGSVVWFLTSTTCDTFEELFDKILVYEELVRVRRIEKCQSRAYIHVVDDVFATNNYNNRGWDHHYK